MIQENNIDAALIVFQNIQRKISIFFPKISASETR